MSSSDWTAKAISQPRVVEREVSHRLSQCSVSSPSPPLKRRKTRLPSTIDPLGRSKAFSSFSCVFLSSRIEEMSEGVSSGEGDHFVSHILGAWDSEGTVSRGVESPPVEWSEEEVEEEAPVPRVTRGKSKGAVSASHGVGPRTSKSSTRPSQGPMFEESTLIEEELSWLKIKYTIPDEFHLRLPRAEEWVQNYPSNTLGIYEEDLAAGLRLPFHDLIVQVLNRYRVVPAQLAPNFFRLIVGFVVLCALDGIRPRFPLFRSLFHLYKVSGSKGWWSFGPRKGRKVFSLPTSIHNWKGRYFFMSFDLDLGFSTDWTELDTSPNQNDQVYCADQDDFRRLTGEEALRFQDLLSEENLLFAKIIGGPSGRLFFQQL